MRSAICFVFLSLSASAQTEEWVNLGHIPDGISYRMIPSPSSSTMEKVRLELEKVVKVENLKKMTVNAKLVFVISQLAPTKPVRIDVMYHRVHDNTTVSRLFPSKEVCRYQYQSPEISTDKNIPLVIEKVIQEVKKFPTSGPPTRKPLLYRGSAQTPTGLRFFVDDHPKKSFQNKRMAPPTSRGANSSSKPQE